MAGFSELVSAVETATGRPGRRSGHNTRLLCPAHDDHHPSLDVAEGDDGSPLVKCRSCGAGLAEVAAALGREARDFLPARSEGADDEWTPHGRAVARYPYVDEGGNLLFEVCRTADKQFPQRKPDPGSKSGWRWTTKGVRLVPYCLPELLEAVDSGDVVYVCEGEKDVEAIRAAGAVATCNPMGAGKWRAEYAQHFAGAFSVVIVADNDAAGIAHARAVEESLRSLNGSAPALLEVVVPAEGNDASDHLAAGLGLSDFRAIPPDGADHEPVGLVLADFLALDFAAPPPFLGTSADTVIPAGGFCLLAGMPGVGKTTLAIDLAFHLAEGRDWLDVPVERPVNVLLVENEGPQHKFQEKLSRKLSRWEGEAAGRIFVQTWRWGQFSFRDPDQTEAVRAFLEHAQIDVVIGDPLDTLGTTGVGSPEETREFLALLVPLGLTEHRTFIFLHHFRKEITPSELNMVSGSWGGRLDTLLVLKQTERDDELRLSYPKVRWGTQHPERRPLILGKVANTLGFDKIAEEAHELTGDSKVDEILDRIIGFIRSRGGGPVERSVISVNVESASATLTRALRSGVEHGVLASGKDGKKAIYSLTPDTWEDAA